jgi:hypothetical protein
MPKRARSSAATASQSADAEPAKRAKQEMLLDTAVRMKPPKKAKWKPEEAVEGRLQLDGTRLVFTYAAGSSKAPIEVLREQVNDCKAAKGTALVQVVVQGEKRPLVFDMLAMDAAATMRERLRARSAEELAAEAEATRRREAKATREREAKALQQRQDDERKTYLAAHADARERFDELVTSRRLTEDDFWSEGSVRDTQLVRALDALEPEEEPPLAGEDNIIRIHFERAMLPRLLACQPALNEAHRKLVLEGQLNERLFWQHYVCVRHTLDPADLVGISRTANSEDERRRKEADLNHAIGVIRDAVQIDSRTRLEEEELELTSDARDGMELLVGGATRASAGARYRKGYGLLGENAEAFFSGKAMQSSGRQHAPDILKQLNMAGDHVVLQQLLGEATLRHLPHRPEAGSGDADSDEDEVPHDGLTLFARRTHRPPPPPQGAAAGGQLQEKQESQRGQLHYSSLEIFDAEYCYARRSRSAATAPGSARALASSPRSLSAKPSAAATALTLTLSGGGSWRPDPKRRVGDTAAAGTPRATAFDAPTRTDTNAWHSAPLGSPAAKDWDDSSGDAAATTFKADLCKYARMADTLLAQFWLAIREQDTAKVQRLGAYGEHGKGSLEQLYDEVQGRFSENATVSKSLYVALHHAFEAFDKFAQDQLFDQ